MDRVYVTRHLPEGSLRPLLERYDVGVWEGSGPVPHDVLMSEVEGCSGLLCMLTDDIDAELVDRAPKLRVVSQMAVGVDNIDVEACEQRGVAVGHTPGVLTETVADTAFALLGSIVRRLPEGERIVKEGRWGPWSPSFLNGGDLHGTTLGIVGMGRIGRAVARRSVGFDMEILYSSPRPVPDAPGAQVDFAVLLRASDHVMLSVSLNPRTHHLIGAGELEMMGEHSYLVNVSRGPVVDTDALVDALGSGSIAGAALDVTDPEPLPSDHPLLSLPNCLVVPHIASSSVETRRAMADLAVSNLLAGLAGRSMPARFGA